MHTQKLKGPSCKKLAVEAIDRVGSKVGSIDHSRSYLNYNLCPHQPPSYEPGELDRYIKETLGVTRKIRDDAVREVSLIIDYPADETIPPERFFRTAYEGLKEYYHLTDEKVAYAMVHMDETHPHMHLAFFPVKDQEHTRRDGTVITRPVLSAKEIVNRGNLKQLHPYMQKYMHEHGATGTLWHHDGVKRDKDFLTYKLEAQQKEYQEIKTRKGIVEDMNPALVDTKPIAFSKDEVKVSKADLEAVCVQAGLTQAATDRAIKAEAKTQAMQKEMARLNTHVEVVDKNVAKREADVKRREANVDKRIEQQTKELSAKVQKLEAENRELTARATKAENAVSYWKHVAFDLASKLYTALRHFAGDLEENFFGLAQETADKSDAEWGQDVKEILAMQDDIDGRQREGEER